MDYMDNFNYWYQSVCTAEEHAELDAIRNDAEELKGRFGSQLQFGTAGMRGIMGLGSNRLNEYTVRRAAQGMAAWLSSTDLPQFAAIAYDSRHNSAIFAQICAVAFADAGVKTWLYDRLAPTPMLSFAVRELNCGCGIVISASHNAGIYNGVKCYGPDGCQLTDEPAAVVTECISKIPYFVKPKNDFSTYLGDGMIRYIPQSLWNKYYDTIMAESIAPELVRSADLNVVYTPLCGTGNEPVREIMNRLGVNVNAVAIQEKPDGDFKTCEYPNPETDAALNESYKVASVVPCDVIIGTDPDADRVAIAVPNGQGGFRKLTGNELGCLLLEYILKARANKGDIPSGAITVRSIVSSPLADRIAERYGVEMVSVLTGFKYIGGEILKLEESGEENRFIFAFEESCGYLKGTYARDKDAIVASMLICELAASLKLRGKDILDALSEMYSTYGYCVCHVQSVELAGSDAMEKAAAMMANLRSQTPQSIAGQKVTIVRDYQCSVSYDVVNDVTTHIDLPRSNVLELVLGDFGSVIVRPSGTEPKVKFYYTAIASAQAEAEVFLDKMIKQMSK